MHQITILGLGWLGYPLAESLLSKGYELNGTTTSVKKADEINLNSNIRAFELNLSENINDKLIDFISQSKIVFLAIPASKVFLNLENVITLFNKLDSDKEVILISSTGVYPDTLEIAEEDYHFKEEELLNSNVQIEQRLKSQIKQRLTIVRLAGLIGPNRHPITILSQKSNIADGLAPVNLIHLNDVIALLEMIIEKKYFGETVNGCYPSHPTREKYYTNAAVKYNLPIPTFQNNTSKTKIISSKKSQIDLGFTYNQEI